MTLTDWYISEGIESIGDMFRWLRIAHNLSLDDVVKETAVSKSTLSRFENGKCDIRLSTLIKLIKHYDYIIFLITND